MQFDDFLGVIWKRRVIVALTLVACVLAAGAYAFTQPKRYESTATIAFTPDPKGGQTYVPTDNLAALLSTYAAVAKSRENKDAAAKLLGRPLPGEIETSTGAGSGILDVIGRDTDPQGAADTARTAAQALSNRLANNGLLVPSIVNPAVPSATPIQPRPPLILSVAILLGLIAGVLLALVLERMRRTIETGDEVTEATALPVLGRLPRERSLARSDAQLVWETGDYEVLQESYRALRTNVELLRDGDWSVLQVTSAKPGEGKSTVVANLAIALGQIGVRTVVIDADLRRPRQHDLFGLRNDVGLSTAMTISDTVVQPSPTAYANVRVLTSGPISANAAELLHVRFGRVLRQVKADADIVLIDSPPVLPVSDARVIAPSADATAFVVGAERSQTSAIVSAVDKLRFAHANLIGAIVNFANSQDGEQIAAYGYGPYISPQQNAQPIPAGLGRDNANA
ncbi:MAG TPA: polysaccharide biosynthesis tyrosine autokinase [Baekduia sp.]|uniref:polysaccharide biosynthesis tyrosine autokinase n=1 Tax=Baekduia sp. TaxID=2600305 RepID=UPI002D797792|nr:polysaccharide biosynthesis tyrosine autokinase [Baekduia sp.]HET6508413.1 polysaccharide biosynthesis tyrosine autokinase [Baekduia sp.]